VLLSFIDDLLTCRRPAGPFRRAPRERSAASQGNKMIKIIQDLRIGTKLAVTSGISVLLVGVMIFSQMSGNAAVGQSTLTMNQQNELAHFALQAKASVRGMMIAVRDARLARKAEELQAAQAYLDERHKSAQSNISETLKLSKNPENHARIEKMNVLVDQYLNQTAKQVIGIQKEALGIEAKRSASGELEGVGLANCSTGFAGDPRRGGRRSDRGAYDDRAAQTCGVFFRFRRKRQERATARRKPV